jgi:hypothetical protein
MGDREHALDAAHRRATEFLGTLDDRPVWPRASLDDMLDAFGGPLDEHGLDAASVIEGMASRAGPGLVAIPGGRFFGFVIGATLPAALAADWLVSAWDQNSGSSMLAPATVAMERVAGACRRRVRPVGSGIPRCARPDVGRAGCRLLGHGRAALRCSMSSWATTHDDVERAVTAVRSLV